MKVQPTILLSKEQKKDTYICVKSVIHTIHEIGIKSIIGT